VDWIELGLNRDRWRTLANTVRDFCFQRMQGISQLAEQLLASQRGLCSVELVCWLHTNIYTFKGKFTRVYAMKAYQAEWR
jgi:hypothetical protein